MSDTTASLQRQIRSATDLQSVVRTMKSLAASQIGQYEKSVRALAIYARAIDLGLGACLRERDPTARARDDHPQRVPGPVCAIVFGSDQGLVGQFNDGIAAYAMRTLAPMPGKHVVVAIGDRVRARLLDAGVAVVGQFGVPNSVEAISSLIGDIQVTIEGLQAQSDAHQVYVIHNRPLSGSAYEPNCQRLLPLDRTWERRAADIRWPTPIPPETVCASSTVLPALITEYLFISLFKACAESLASENASRLSAMERANRNIDELLEGFQATFHRLRQDGIDEELFDVIFGFEALGTGS
jgi:F-type H+-transporting ATPase subunit gamma